MPDELKMPDPTNPREIRAVYSNSANVMATNWDVQIIFAEIVATPDVKGVTHELCAHVVMSHEHTKAFYEVFKGLMERIDKEEKK